MLAGSTGKHIAMAGRLGSGPALGPKAWLVCAVLLSLALPMAALGGDWCEPPNRLVQTAGDEFRSGLAHWRFEAEDARAQVQAIEGWLDIQTPAGLSLWWREPLVGDYTIRFTALALPAPASAGVHAGRLSDLNMFWNAAEADGSAPRPRSGAFAGYDDLELDYVGFGANANTSTRLRAYRGGQRRLIAGYADKAIAEPSERAMHEGTRLHPGRAQRVEIVSRRPTVADPVHLRWSVDGHLLFSRSDAEPRLQGSFALRSTASHLQIRNFQILQCLKP
jgi:Domain of unknown function (DUF6250)